MAFAAERDDLRGGGQFRASNRHFGEPGVDRLPVIARRAMTALAADAMVERLGASRRFLDGAEIGRVAVQALADRFGRDGTAQITLSVRRGDGVFHGPAPLGRARDSATTRSSRTCPCSSAPETIARGGSTPLRTGPER